MDATILCRNGDWAPLGRKNVSKEQMLFVEVVVVMGGVFEFDKSQVIAAVVQPSVPDPHLFTH